MSEAINDKRLLVYLDDHLALIVGEVLLVGRSRSNYAGTSLGEFLQQVEAEVSDQKSVVEDLIQRVGGKQKRSKHGAEWVSEKLGRFKLNGTLLKYPELSRLIELEVLGAVAQERVAMWESLDHVSSADSRLDGIDFAKLRDRSQRYLNELNQRRRVETGAALVGE